MVLIVMGEILIGIILLVGRIFGEVVVFLYIVGLSLKNLNFNEISLSGSRLVFLFFRFVEILVVYIWKLNLEGIVFDVV